MVDGSGYEQMQVSDRVFQVRFAGNRFTKSQRAKDYALLRAAEIGEQLGYDYMVVRGTQDEGRSDLQYAGSSTSTSTNYAGYTTTTTTPQFSSVYTPGTLVVVEFFDETSAERVLEQYRCSDLAARLRAQYELPLTSQGMAP